MLLTFSSDDFVQKIKDRTKIHTIRADKHDRWKVGMQIHFWRGNPRNTKSHPYAFGEGVVEKIEYIQMKKHIDWFSIRIMNHKMEQIVFSEYTYDHSILAKNDGFEEVSSFFGFFFPVGLKGDLIWEGKIIHWEQSSLNFFQSETNSNQLKLL